MRKSLDALAIERAEDAAVWEAVLRCAKKRDNAVGFLADAAADLEISYQRLGRILRRRGLKKRWAKFKNEVRKHRARRRRLMHEQRKAARDGAGAADSFLT